MACYVFGAGSFFGFDREIAPEDYVIAADGGWAACQSAGITPDLLLGDFDSIEAMPSFPNTVRMPVEKDDTDMMLAIKQGLELGHREFHLYGGMGGSRTDHTVANFQALAYLARHGARGWLYGKCESYTAICDEEIIFPAQKDGILSVFCWGPDAEGVTIAGGHYPLTEGTMQAHMPLGVSNHFEGKPITVRVRKGCLLLGLHDE